MDNENNNNNDDIQGGNNNGVNDNNENTENNDQNIDQNDNDAQNSDSGIDMPEDDMMGDGGEIITGAMSTDDLGTVEGGSDDATSYVPQSSGDARRSMPAGTFRISLSCPTNAPNTAKTATALNRTMTRSRYILAIVHITKMRSSKEIAIWRSEQI